jgi:hypothetical protein
VERLALARRARARDATRTGIGGAVGYWIAAGLMVAAALTEVVFGVDAEQQSLEDIAEPLSAQEASA